MIECQGRVLVAVGAEAAIALKNLIYSSRV